jgi:hypothetical protein
MTRRTPMSCVHVTSSTTLGRAMVDPDPLRLPVVEQERSLDCATRWPNATRGAGRRYRMVQEMSRLFPAAATAAERWLAKNTPEACRDIVRV